uniref:TIR domain-containing protein n=1 Tax=Neogobius melanostomus TaxID=47308 RepID=A0A8C6U0V5_9GOBI
MTFYYISLNFRNPHKTCAQNIYSMKLQPTSLFSLLFLLLPQPSLFYSLKNCTIDLYDHSKVSCNFNKFITVPSGIPKTTTDLSLNSNHISRIRRTDFNGFTALQSLSLKRNQISHIEDEAFSDLSALTQLDLAGNKLRNLTDNTFTGLSNLLVLILASNDIEFISRLSFQPLAKLTDITNIVSHCLSLKALDLSENSLMSFESDLIPFPLLNLTALKLGSHLRNFSVRSDVFPQLESLVLSGTGAGFEWEVSDNVFFRSLKTLDLDLFGLPTQTYKMIFQSFDSLENLHIRDFGRSFDQRVFDFACSVQSLQMLDIRHRNISVIDDALLQSCSNLTELMLYSNTLSDVSESALRMFTRLTRLNIESNELSRIPPTIQNMSTIAYLSFQSNHIAKLGCSDFKDMASLTEINLNSNRISKLNSCVFKEHKNLKVLYVTNNLFSQLDDNFGISLYSLVVFNTSDNHIGSIQKGTFRGMSQLTDLNIKSKSQLTLQRGAFEGLRGLKRLTLSLDYQSGSVFEGLDQLERLVVFISSTIEMTNFTVYEPMTFNIDSLQELIIEVDKNACAYQALYLLHGLKRLRVLSLDTVCCLFPPGIFLQIPHLLNLRITNCVEFIADPDLFQPVSDLQALDLSHNQIKYLNISINTNLTKLETLILKNNELTVINKTLFEGLPSLKYLDLSGNPFVCDCSNAGFIEWALRNKQVQVANAFQYRCSSPSSEEGRFLFDFNVRLCWEFTGFLYFISSSALVLLTLLLSFIFHFLRWQLVYGYYLILAFLYDSKKRRQGCPHIYDAFVSYNVHDEDWVYRELMPELEERQGWKLCLHHRDFLPGRKPIMENITDAIYSSRKTLCVISRRYLQSEWCSREIQLASFRLFDEQKDVLVLLFLEEISKLVKRRTYLSWTQARSHKGLFWEKVRRALECGNEPGDNQNPITANA